MDRIDAYRLSGTAGRVGVIVIELDMVATCCRRPYDVGVPNELCLADRRTLKATSESVGASGKSLMKRVQVALLAC